MNKKNRIGRKLDLKLETLAPLQSDVLEGVAGGGLPPIHDPPPTWKDKLETLTKPPLPPLRTISPRRDP